MSVFTEVTMDAGAPRLLPAEQADGPTGDVRGVGLYEPHAKKTYLDDGTVRLTTHRLLWLSPDSSRCVALPHRDVAKVDHSVPKLRGSSKVVLWLTGDRGSVVLKCHKGGEPQLFKRYREIYNRRPWEQQHQHTQSMPNNVVGGGGGGGDPSTMAGTSRTQSQPQGFTATTAGVGGIMRRQEDRHQTTDAAMQAAFADIKALMGLAEEMVAISKRFADHLESGDADAQEMREMMQSMGIQAPVTKSTAGSSFHKRLAEELARFLAESMLPRYKGMAPLSDVYCVYNRARGSDLISPDDVYRACMLFERMRLPVKLRKFDDGVLVVQMATHSDEAVAREMRTLIDRDGPQTPFDVAQETGVSLALAKEQLLVAEEQGLLCRDESIEGLVFWRNIFVEEE